MDLQLTGHGALVSGASQGLGRAVALALAAEGATVAITARRKDLLDELADEMAASGHQRPVVLPADLLEPGATADLAARAEAELGKVDILVNCAGGTEPMGFGADTAVWDRVLHLNYTAMRDLTHALVPGMRARGYGRILNVTGSTEPANTNAAYPAKAATQAWSKGLSWEVAKDGVTVNCLQPGRIMSEQVAQKHYPSASDRDAFAATHIPMGRFGEPEEFAYVAVVLCSPLAGYVTGASIPVDGGLKRSTF